VLPPGTNATLVGRGTASVWRYRDAASAAPANWMTNGFDDSGWPSGPAQLGFGESDQNTTIADNNQITSYFRKSFVITDPGAYTNLGMWLLRDDGGVVHLNGVEVFRSPNLPAAPAVISYNTTTLSGQNGENTIDTAVLSAGQLRAGTNVVAVEIHQAEPDSSDVSFDFELIGYAGPVGVPGAPTMISPTNGQEVAAGNIGVVVAGGGPWTNVLLYADTALVGEDASAPYEFTVSGLGVGEHELVAVGMEGRGVRMMSAPVGVRVVGEADSDGDGMPDAWELAHGLNPQVNDAQGDADGDGMTNLGEYEAGTDPQDAASYLRISRVEALAGTQVLVNLEFEAVGGKSYTVWGRDGLTNGVWGVITNVSPATSNQTVRVQDTLPASQTQRFYRLGIP
jgi:hypothetical protein